MWATKLCRNLTGWKGSQGDESRKQSAAILGGGDALYRGVLGLGLRRRAEQPVGSRRYCGEFCRARDCR